MDEKMMDEQVNYVPVYGIRDKILIPVTVILAFIFVEQFYSTSLFLSRYPGLLTCILGLGVISVHLWYTWPYCKSVQTMLLYLPGVLLALRFALFSRDSLWTLEFIALIALSFMAVYLRGGLLHTSWGDPRMLWEGLKRFFSNLFVYIPKPVSIIAESLRFKRSSAKYVLLGLLVSVPVLLIVLPLMISADMVFESMLTQIGRYFQTYLSSFVERFFVAIALAFPLFSAVYASCHPPLKRGIDEKAHGQRLLVPALVNTVLVALAVIYLFFVIVQFSYLFGGAGQLTVRGISYADYARSGFFQMVTIALFNLILIMAGTLLSKPGETGYRLTQVLASLLLVMTGVILASAWYRMHLYISQYGLSVLRFFTLWGMVMITIWLLTAAVKVWQSKLGYFKILLLSSVIGWLILSFSGMNGIIAKYNVDGYMSGDLETVDVSYLADHLSDASLPHLERLYEHVQDLTPQMCAEGTGCTPGELATIIQHKRQSIQATCADWHSWNLESYLLSREP